MFNLDWCPERLERTSYSEIFQTMVDRQAFLPESRPFGQQVRVERSFAGNMRRMLQEVHPEVFLFTHRSAVPIADSVRAYYEELGLPVPELGIVNTKNNFLCREPTGITSSMVLDREVPRLIPLVEGKKVAIIDQYINTRGTVTSAQRIALGAGATAVAVPDAARWYEQAAIDDINLDTLSSVHRDQMRLIGRASAFQHEGR